MTQKMTKILIAEDERPVAKALQLKLKHTGFDVIVASDGEEAVAALKDNDFALVILDLMMPKLDGFGVLAAMKEQGIQTPVIVASNLSQVEDIERAKGLGASDYYVKSDTPIATIVEKIQAAIAA